MTEQQEAQLPATQPPAFSIAPGGNQVVKATERVEMQRATAEVFFAHQRAIQHPRDRQACIEEMLDLCKDIYFASEALYRVPRGKDDVEGLGVKAAKDFAQIWGNIESGIVYHGRYGNETQMKAFAIDLEKNYPRSITFTVEHRRKSGDKITEVTDPNQIEELCKARASKEERNCILSVLPNYLKSMMVKRIKQTLHEEVKNVQEAWNGWVKLFAPLGIAPFSLLGYVNRKDPGKLTEADIVDLRVLYSTFREDPSQMDEVFPERDKNKAPVAKKEEQPSEQKAVATQPPKPRSARTTATSAPKATEPADADDAARTAEPASSTTEAEPEKSEEPEMNSETAQDVESTTTTEETVATEPPKRVRLY